MTITPCCNNFRDIVLGPYCEGASRISKAFRPLPQPLQTASTGQKFAHRVKLFVVGLGLLILPLINMIIRLALKHFEKKQIPLARIPVTNTVVAPPIKDDSTNLTAPYANLRKIGLPNFATPKLSNICWLNTVCQCLFRTPQLAKLLFSDSNANPPKLITLLRQLYCAMHKTDNTNSSEVHAILEETVEHYAKRNPQFKVGDGHDATAFLGRILNALQFSFVQSNVFGHDEAISRSNMLFLSYQPIISMENYYLNNLYAELKLNSTILNSPVPVLIFNFNLPATIPYDDLPNEIDFSFLFSDEVRKNNANFRYRLTLGTRHDGGHYSAQSLKDYTNYDDSVVSVVSRDDAVRNLRQSPIHIWERIDD